MVSGDGLTEMYRGIIEQYPVASIEDPFDQVRHCRSLLLLLLLLLLVVVVVLLLMVGREWVREVSKLNRGIAWRCVVGGG